MLFLSYYLWGVVPPERPKRWKFEAKITKFPQKFLTCEEKWPKSELFFLWGGKKLVCQLLRNFHAMCLFRSAKKSGKIR